MKSFRELKAPFHIFKIVALYKDYWIAFNITSCYIWNILAFQLSPPDFERLDPILINFKGLDPPTNFPLAASPHPDVPLWINLVSTDCQNIYFAHNWIVNLGQRRRNKICTFSFVNMEVNRTTTILLYPNGVNKTSLYQKIWSSFQAVRFDCKHIKKLYSIVLLKSFILFLWRICMYKSKGKVEEIALTL